MKTAIHLVVKRLIDVFKGLNLLLPVIDRISYVQSLKEIAIEVPSQTAISKGWFQVKFVGKCTVCFSRQCYTKHRWCFVSESI